MNIPPITDYVFLTCSNSLETYMVERNGHIWRLPPSPKPLFQPEHQCSAIFDWSMHVANEHVRWHWRKGWLPVLEILNACDDIELFANGEGLWIQYNGGQHDEIISPDGKHHPIDKDTFEDKVEAINREWSSFFDGTPEPQPLPGEKSEAWRATIVQGFIAGCGMHPKYGVGSYHDGVHDGFPPQTIAILDMLLELGKHEEAGKRLEYYLNRFVQADGTIDYFGPALSEYGMLLSLAARIALSPSGSDWIHRNSSGIMRITRMLRRLGDFIITPGDERFPGLLCGVPEADTNDRPAIYTHNNAWAWRGLRDWSHAATANGLIETAAECALEAERICLALRSALEANRLPDGLPPYRLPSESTLPDFTSNRDITYANYRYYPELLESGFLSRQEALAVIRAREEKGGELHGATLFNFRAAYPSLENIRPLYLDDWPIASYGIALADLGEHKRLERVIHGHYMLHQSQDTFTAYESVDADNGPTSPRHAFTDWCVPAQLAYPRMLIRLYNAQG